MTTLTDRLRELAEAVAACEWELPIDAQETLREAAEAVKQLHALSDGVNVRCGADINQLPLVSLDIFTNTLRERLAAAEANLDCDCPLCGAEKTTHASLRERLAAAELMWQTAVEAEGTDWADEIIQEAAERRAG